MKISYGKSADAIYIRIRPARIGKSKRFDQNLIVDFDSKGRACGVEILNVSEWVSNKGRSVKIGTRKIPIPAFA